MGQSALLGKLVRELGTVDGFIALRPIPGSRGSASCRVRVHRPGWLKTRGFRVSDNRNSLVLRLSDFTETLENKGSHPMNAYPSLSTLTLPVFRGVVVPSSGTAQGLTRGGPDNL